jgi:hypothetical protein
MIVGADIPYVLTGKPTPARGKARELAKKVA